MFQLRTGYLLSGALMGIALVVSVVLSVPDGMLHIVFCDVGQGDAAYIRFPDGRDMLVDGGPDDKVLGCLGRHMPFWDRHIDMVTMTHPQKDHMQGLLSVIDRYQIDYFLRSDVANTTEGYELLLKRLTSKRIPVKFLTRGERITVDTSTLSLLWPSSLQIAKAHTPTSGNTNDVLGAAAPGDLNDYCLVFFLRYGSFDAVFTGDADSHVEPGYTGDKLADNQVELLKVPHHGSRTGMTQAFVSWLHPKLAVVSVGKNTYGHPAVEAIRLLTDAGSEIHRTDEEGDVEIISDGNTWTVSSKKKIN